MVDQTHKYSSSEAGGYLQLQARNNTPPQISNLKYLRPKIGDFSIDLPESFIEKKAKDIKYALNKGGEVNLHALKVLLRKHLTEKYQEIRETNWSYRQRHQVLIQEGVTYFLSE